MAKKARMECYLSSAFSKDNVSREQRAASLLVLQAGQCSLVGQPTSSGLAGQRILAADASGTKRDPAYLVYPG